MRLRYIALAVSICCLLLILALFYTQVLNWNKYYKLSENNRVRLIPLEGPRGIIYDRNLAVMAGSRLSFDVVLIPQEVQDLNLILNSLSPVLNQPVSDLKKIYDRNCLAPFVPVVIASDVEKSKAIEVEEKKLSLPGLVVQARPKRNYPYGSSAAHILGYLGKISQSELDYLGEYGYQITDWVGKTGLEKYADTYLKGEDGGIQLEVNNRGFMVRTLGEKEAKKGKDLVLTIDMRLQKLLDDLLGDRKGAAVVMDVYSGEILALASAPKFDPNLFIKPDNKSYVKKMLTDYDRSLLNRSSGSGSAGQYPPGSIFKVITALAGLESKKLNAQTTFECGGSYRLGNQVFNCWKQEGHGRLDLEQALAQSCNVYFFKAGSNIGSELIEKWATDFGLGAPTGIDLPMESKGFVPDKNWKRNVIKEPWYEGDTLNLSIGQGYLLVTPLQMARLTCAMANGGYLVSPHLIKTINNQEVAKIRGKKINISSQSLAVLKEGMSKVIAQDYGTGHRARVEGVSIAGKTGTAETSSGASHAWFIGFAPTDKPKIAFCVFLEHGGRGGDVPADIVKQLFEYLKQINYL